jgi:hypothetical protein
MSVETLSITHGQRTPEERADLEARLGALRQAFERIATPELRESSSRRSSS